MTPAPLPQLHFAALRRHLAGDYGLGAPSSAGPLCTLGVHVQSSAVVHEPSAWQMAAARTARLTEARLRSLTTRRRPDDPTLEQVLRRAYGPPVTVGRTSVVGLDPERALGGYSRDRDVSLTAPLVHVICLLSRTHEARLESGVPTVVWLRALVAQVRHERGAHVERARRLLTSLVMDAAELLAVAGTAYRRAREPRAKVVGADVAEAATYLGITRRRLRQLVDGGRFGTVRRGPRGLRIGWCCLRRERVIRVAAVAAGVGRKGLVAGEVLPCGCVAVDGE